MIPDCLPLTLGQLSRVLGGEPALGEHLRRVLTDGSWFTGDLAITIDGFADEARNPVAHGEPVARDVVLRWRDRLLGVGGEGIVARLARIKRVTHP